MSITSKRAAECLGMAASFNGCGRCDSDEFREAVRAGIAALREKAQREEKKTPSVIKTAKNVEFDVIYDDGTRRHVTEGVLFEVENEQIIFHNGTDRLEVVAAACEAAAEVMGSIMLPRCVKETIIANVCDKIGFGVPEE